MSGVENEMAPEEAWTRVGRYPDLREAHDHGLVVLAMGESCRVDPVGPDGAFDLHAEQGPAPRVAAELAAYDRESAQTVPYSGPVSQSLHPAGWLWFAIWAIVVTGVFVWQQFDFNLTDLAASSSRGLIDRHEWWRPFTALFLHGDVMHLFANLLSASAFITWVVRSIGALRGWLLTLVCGTIGNMITARVMYPESFLSIGASTAIFAALGILAGLGVVEMVRTHLSRSLAKIAAPLLAGIVLLGWLGAGHDGTTDVLGHVFGFSAGVAGGLVVGATMTSQPGERTSAERS